MTWGGPAKIQRNKNPNPSTNNTPLKLMMKYWTSTLCYPEYLAMYTDKKHVRPGSSMQVRKGRRDRGGKVEEKPGEWVTTERVRRKERKGVDRRGKRNMRWDESRGNDKKRG